MSFVFVVHVHTRTLISFVQKNAENTLHRLLLPAQCARPSADTTLLHSMLLQSCFIARHGSRGRQLKRENLGALGPTASHIGTLLDEAVDDDAVAVDRGVLVVERVDERLGQVEQALCWE